MMLAPIPIPGHITALYVFAVVNLMALCHISLVEANIIVMKGDNDTIVTIPDMPASFGPRFPPDGLWGHVVYAVPDSACSSIAPPPKTHKGDYKWIALIRRRDCDFDVKVANAESAGYIAAIVHNVDSDELVPMGPGKGPRVNISSAFVSESNGLYLRKCCSGKTDFTIIMDGVSPISANMYLIPFAIVVAVCFILMIVFMVAKWVRDIRRRRRARLSKEQIKKLPVKKFKKGDEYDVCAICLDEYEDGDKLRILPCSHAYHMKCVDPWLTKNKKTCPVCKRKVIPGADSDDSDTESEDESDSASETTPLLVNETATGARNNEAFENSGLPGNVRPDVRAINASYTDDETDVSAGSSPATFRSQSAVEVHRSSVGSSRGRSYGATASVVDERADTASISSNRSNCSNRSRHSNQGSPVNKDDEEELLGAVGGVDVEAEVLKLDECVDIVDDYYGNEDNEMSGLISGDTNDDAGEEVQVRIFPLPKRNKKSKKKKKRRRDEEA